MENIHVTTKSQLIKIKNNIFQTFIHLFLLVKRAWFFKSLKPLILKTRIKVIIKQVYVTLKSLK